MVKSEENFSEHRNNISIVLRFYHNTMRFIILLNWKINTQHGIFKTDDLTIILSSETECCSNDFFQIILPNSDDSETTRFTILL